MNRRGQDRLPPGIPWGDVPDDWVCPIRGARKVALSAASQIPLAQV
ncbi:MAG: rubredoxin [Chromatiaceae bacterium]|nr:rubredoxin [Chromatiaceae bacterium]